LDYVPIDGIDPQPAFGYVGLNEIILHLVEINHLDVEVKTTETIYLLSDQGTEKVAIVALPLSFDDV